MLRACVVTTAVVVLAARAAAECTPDTVCSTFETCASCPEDCGVCPNHTGFPTCDPGAPQSFDGKCNNLNHPGWGAVGSSLQRMAQRVHYVLGTDGDVPTTFPNARTVSNTVFDQPGDMPSARNLNALTTFFGQFVNHDVHATDTDSAGGTLASDVPPGDVWMQPRSSLSVTRMAVTPGTGTGGKPRAPQVRKVSGFLDGSTVYGNSDACATALRAGVDGLLKEEQYENGVFPPLDDGPGLAACEMDSLFSAPTVAAGDFRANENPGLFSVHILFFRNHNYWARKLRDRDASLLDEEVYQWARTLNRAEIQSIFVNEWYPAITGEQLPPYTGYDDKKDPSPFVEVMAAAFRLGHTMVNPQFTRMADMTNDTPCCGGPLNLRDVFFRPEIVTGDKCVGVCPNPSMLGLDSFVAGLLRSPSQEIDVFVTDPLRNFLFQEGGPAMDLLTINLLRGRDVGLPLYNDARSSLGLAPNLAWSDVTSNLRLQFRLAEAYPDGPSSMDLYVGGLAEDPNGDPAGSSLGELFTTILRNWIVHERASDRFWFENDGILAEGSTHYKMLEAVRSTTMRDIIRRNTDLIRVPPQAFFTFQSQRP